MKIFSKQTESFEGMHSITIDRMKNRMNKNANFVASYFDMQLSSTNQSMHCYISSTYSVMVTFYALNLSTDYKVRDHL